MIRMPVSALASRTAILCGLVLLASAAAFAQGGSGELPSVPKTAPKPKTTKGKPPAKPAAPKVVEAKEPARVERINFNGNTEGKIEASTAGRIPPNVYYQEYSITATDADVFYIQLTSPQPTLKVELIDEKRTEVPLVKDEINGQYRPNTSGGVLVEDGEYRLRVTYMTTSLTSSVPYSLKVVRTGLTSAGYQDRLQKIIQAFNLPGEKKVDATIAQLEQLTQDDPLRPGGFEYLGLLYDQYKQDIVKASASMLQAIKLGGAATFKITHDAKWRRPSRDKKNQELTWTEQRTDWIKISKGQVVVVDSSAPDKPLAVFKGGALVEAMRPPAFPAGPVVVLRHSIKTIKPDILFVGFKSAAEAEVAIDLIKDHVLKAQ